MGRPVKPLISRERAARAALGVIDVHGLDALSLEMVASRLGVKAPSLYYHFKHKAELLEEVARLILLDVKAPDPKTLDWKEAMVELSVATRRSILAHPNAALLLLQFFPRHTLLAAYDYWLAPSPLPPELHLVMLEGTEKLTFGAALFEAAYRARSIEPMPLFDRTKLPHLAAAMRANLLGEEELFMATLRSFLIGLETVAASMTAATAKAKPAGTAKKMSKVVATKKKPVKRKA
ncbi:MAG: hypothetical protein JWQ90_2611 [Hydrocarboniphaga sp.]|uniref:TetR/AcrR family transcriptional regulator n=1 Tax=Hydrocarboniphaga sp. TaxID=2033016 RepID=UPI00260583BC|nr:TetR/AcrR family transcriptional regulator [Hydrocarboniphaga sp.]MDB5970161.1 hypothetical protein [Hydrocarboniphaga sp.]